MKFLRRRLAVVALALVVLSCAPLHAQKEDTASSESSASQAQQKHEPENPNRAVGKELAEASKAAEGEPEEDQTTGLKHSSAVRWMAKTFGVSVETAYWIAMAFNFAVIIAVIAWFMKSSLPAYFRSRNESIARGITEARAASDDAKRRLADIENRLSRLDAEVADIRATSEKESAAEEQRVRGAAEADVKRILESAEQEIDAASRQARRDLKSLAAGLAVDLAARKLQVDASTDEALIRNFVAQLGKDGK